MEESILSRMKKMLKDTEARLGELEKKGKGDCTIAQSLTHTRASVLHVIEMLEERE